MDLEPSAGSMFRLAFQLHQQGKFTEAEQLYRAVLNADPDSAVAHHNLGTLLAQRNRSDEAIAHFEKAIAIKPDSTESRNNLGNALAHLNRLDQSIVELEKVLEVSRRQAEPYMRACYNIGVSPQTLDRDEEAIPHYQRAIAINPDYAEAHNALGNALTKCSARKKLYRTTRNSLRSGPTWGRRITISASRCTRSTARRRRSRILGRRSRSSLTMRTRMAILVSRWNRWVGSKRRREGVVTRTKFGPREDWKSQLRFRLR
jgi:tetratricopeptide (TPR) repeat protein